MRAPKSLLERERELQKLHRTPDGLLELKAIAAEIVAETGRPLLKGESIITYILVHERDKGLIVV
jgi:hypothetical protein